MTINTLSPTTLTGLLVGDTAHLPGQGPVDAIPRPTKVLVNGKSTPVCAIAEFQSTDGAVLFPRLTQAQVNALPPAGTALTAGMQFFNSTTGALNTFNGVTFMAGSSFATGTLTAVQIDAMEANPINIIPNPGAGFVIVVEQFILNYVHVVSFVGGGNISLEYGNAPAASGTLATGTIPATQLTAANNTYSKVGGATLTSLSGTLANNGLWISNDTAPFTGGAGSTVNYTVIYRVLPIV